MSVMKIGMMRSKNKRLNLSQKILKSKKLSLRLSITLSNLSQAWTNLAK